MKKSITLMLGVIVFFSLLAGVPAQSQSVDRFVVPDRNVIAGAWHESITDLKKSAEALLEENDKLTSENQELYKKIGELQKSIEAIKGESQTLKTEPSRLGKLVEIENSKQKVFQKQLKDLEKKTAPLEKETAVFERKLSALEEKTLPLEESLKSLTAEKTNLEVDLKLKEQSRSTEDIEKLRADNDALAQQIAQTKEQEAGIRKELSGLSRKSPVSKATENIIKDSSSLNRELARLEKEHNAALNEIRNLTKMNNQSQKSQADTFSKKLAEKAGLEEQSKRLGSQILRTRQRMADPLAASPGVERADLDKMISDLEVENHKLEQRIFDLNEAVLLVKRENTMIEALLNVQNNVDSGSFASSRLREGFADSRTVAEAMGYAYATQGMYSEAVEQYEEALKQGGDKKDVYFNLGYVYFKMGNMNEAMRAYKNVLRIDPYDYEAKRNIAKLREEISNIRDSIRKTAD